MELHGTAGHGLARHVMAQYDTHSVHEQHDMARHETVRHGTDPHGRPDSETPTNPYYVNWPGEIRAVLKIKTSRYCLDIWLWLAANRELQYNAGRSATGS